MNFFEKLRLKLSNKQEYKTRKYIERVKRVPPPGLQNDNKDFYYMKHSGNAGDIIYALPAIYALSKGKPVHLLLQLNQKGVYGKEGHPLGNVMLDQNMFNMLAPLLLAQPGIHGCTVFKDEPFDYDLDYFRYYPFQLFKGNISHWYYWVFAIHADTWNPWLKVKADESFEESIVIARSKRYNAPGIDYSFLEQYPNLVFLGVKEEYDSIKKQIPSIVWHPVNDFLEMASVIEGSKLFIGNQSFPFAIAEALKTKRLLEVYYDSPNVAVNGENGFEFCLQPQFELLVERIVGSQVNI
jgi:hypothetical protein